MKPNEELAAYAHDAWSGWVTYLFRRSTENPDGSVTIPPALVTRWKRQMYTSYEDLPEREKKSDREESLKIMRIFIGDDEDDLEGS